VTLRARWVTPRARWVTLRARWVTPRASWMTLRARWVTLRARWVTLRARWVTLRARWVTPRARWVTLRARWVMPRACWVTLRAAGLQVAREEMVRLEKDEADMKQRFSDLRQRVLSQAHKPMGQDIDAATKRIDVRNCHKRNQIDIPVNSRTHLTGLFLYIPGSISTPLLRCFKGVHDNSTH
jgi:hypothetical protein